MSSTRLATAVLAVASCASTASSQCFEQTLSPGLPASPVIGVGLAVDGDHALVSTLIDTGGPRLTAYDRVAGAWVETQDLPTLGDGTWQFGFSLAMEADLAVVGMPGAQPSASGGVAIYRRGPGGWALEDTVFGPFFGEDDTRMGYDVAIDAGVVYTSSLRAEIVSSLFTPARVRVIEQVGGSWEVTNVLFDVSNASTGFGIEIAADDGRLFVGVPFLGSIDGVSSGIGGVRVFDDPSGASSAFELLRPADVALDDVFGSRLAVSDGTLFARSLDDGLPVHVFEEDGGRWSEAARLVSPAGGGFGQALAAADGIGYATTFAFDANQTAGLSVLADDGDGWAIASFRDASGTAKYGLNVATDGATLLVSTADGDAQIDVFDLATVGDTLVACDPEVSIAAPTPATLEVRAGTDAAGRGHFVLGSFSGTSPGFTAQGVSVPLNPDAYFAFTLSSPNTPLLSNSFGQLDVHGQADVVLDLPAGLPAAAAGIVLHHAVVLLDGGPVASSAPVGVELVP